MLSEHESHGRGGLPFLLPSCAVPLPFSQLGRKKKGRYAGKECTQQCTCTQPEDFLLFLATGLAQGQRTQAVTTVP